MNSEEKYHFTHLKKAISRSFLKEKSASENIEDWKGEEIAAFKVDLLEKQKSSISEKWFYTYIKNEPTKLPRIDILNLLSSYSGYENWLAFKEAFPYTQVKKDKKRFKLYALLLIPLFAVLYYFSNSKNEFEFCFIDEDKNESVTGSLDIKIIQNNESPIYLKTDSLGCFSYTTTEKNIRFVVQSPYYKTDTVYRSISSQVNNTIKLNTDDYTLMLHYYANGNVKDIKSRKKQLQNLIAKNAQIYQVFSKNNGIEIYTKDEFINKLIVPTHSLKNMSILSKTYKEKKIVKLKFIIN